MSVSLSVFAVDLHSCRYLFIPGEQEEYALNIFTLISIKDYSFMEFLGGNGLIEGGSIPCSSSGHPCAHAR